MNIDVWKCGPPPATGQKQRYPGRFWFNFKKQYDIPSRVLHMFSGSIEWGDTTDIRPETGAQIRDNTYDMVVADPPYTCGFANEWITHPKDLPKPKWILGEATRVVKPGGIVAILHVIVIPAYKIYNVRRIGLHGILCGPNNAIRVLNVFEKMERLGAYA